MSVRACARGGERGWDGAGSGLWRCWGGAVPSGTAFACAKRCSHGDGDLLGCHFTVTDPSHLFLNPFRFFPKAAFLRRSHTLIPVGGGLSPVQPLLLQHPIDGEHNYFRKGKSVPALTVW